MANFYDSVGPFTFAEGPSGDASGTTDYTRLAANLTTLSDQGGGILLLGQGTYCINQSLHLPDAVEIWGQGKSTWIAACASGFTGTSVVVIGTGTPSPSNITTDSMFRYMTISAEGAVDECVYSAQANENSGLDSVVCQSYLQKGVHIVGAANSGTGHADNPVFRDVVCEGQATAGNLNGLYIDSMPSKAHLENITVIALTGSASTGAGVYFHNCNDATMLSLHVENHTDGVMVDGSNAFVANLTGPSVTNMVHTKNAGTVSGHAINGGPLATYALTNDNLSISQSGYIGVANEGGRLSRRVATTGTGGYALTGSTGTILTYTAPSDGCLHWATFTAQLIVSSAETGGQVNLNVPGLGISIFAAGNATGTFHPLQNSVSGSESFLLRPGDTIAIQQATALTAGAAVLYADLYST